MTQPALDPDTFAALERTLDRFVKERLVPLEHQVAQDDALPDDLVDEMRRMGMFGLTIPAEYGGLGLSASEEVALTFTFARTSPAFRSIFGTNNGIGSRGLVLAGTDAQKARYLPRLASGEIIASFALTEPDSGSDARSLKTSARRDGDGWVLN
ncbi:MAG: acyl-CoA dehydrogenase family protein, partial [Pseudomonadota bacterium]